MHGRLPAIRCRQNKAAQIPMILLPIISLGFLILSLMGALVSFQFFTHYQSLMMLERVHIVNQRQRAQSALGFLVAFSFAAVISLGGLLYPALMGFTPEPVQPANPTSPLPENAPPLPGDGTPPSQAPTAEIPTPPPDPTLDLPPTQILPTAIIGNTGGAGANIRSIAGLGGAVIEVLPDGSRVFLLEGREQIDGFEWQQIEMSDTREGWVVVQYLLSDN